MVSKFVNVRELHGYTPWYVRYSTVHLRMFSTVQLSSPPQTTSLSSIPFFFTTFHSPFSYLPLSLSPTALPRTFLVTCFVTFPLLFFLLPSLLPPLPLPHLSHLLLPSLLPPIPLPSLPPLPLPYLPHLTCIIVVSRYFQLPIKTSSTPRTRSRTRAFPDTESTLYNKERLTAFTHLTDPKGDFITVKLI